MPSADSTQPGYTVQSHGLGLRMEGFSVDGLVFGVVPETSVFSGNSLTPQSLFQGIRYRV